jgi:hypothetical protein
MSPGWTFEMWWPGTELNRRRQPFQVKINSVCNYLRGASRRCKWLKVFAGKTNCG